MRRTMVSLVLGTDMALHSEVVKACSQRSPPALCTQNTNPEVLTVSALYEQGPRSLRQSKWEGMHGVMRKCVTDNR